MILAANPQYVLITPELITGALWLNSSMIVLSILIWYELGSKC